MTNCSYYGEKEDEINKVTSLTVSLEIETEREH